MNTEQLRNMINYLRIEPDPSNRNDAKETTIRVTNMIARTLCVEYNKACCAEEGLDYYYKACDYVNKQYCALMAISNRSWHSYIANVERNVELRTKMYIAANHEYFEANEEHRIKYMEDINKTFYDFVNTFIILLYMMKKKCDVNLDIEK